MKWADKYNVYKAECGILSLSCAWEKGGYVVRVNGRTLQEPYRDIDDAKAAAIDYGRRLLQEAGVALSALEISDA